MTTLNSLSAATISTPTVTALLRALPEIQAEASASAKNLSYAELDERVRNTLAKIVNLVHWLNDGGHQDGSMAVEAPRADESASSPLVQSNVYSVSETVDALSNEAINLKDAKLSMLRFSEGKGHDTYNFSGTMKSSTIMLEGNLVVKDVLHLRSKKLINVSFVGGRDSITIDYRDAELDVSGAFINIVTRPDDQRKPINLKL
ncbi:MAG: hypothetical protein P8Y47_02170 [Alphaproteobacteria bacterium]